MKAKTHLSFCFNYDMWYSAKHKINNQQLTDEQIVFTKHAKGYSKILAFLEDTETNLVRTETPHQ